MCFIEQLLEVTVQKTAAVRPHTDYLTIQDERDTRDTEDVRKNAQIMFSYGFLLINEPVLADQQTYISPVRTLDTA